MKKIIIAGLVVLSLAAIAYVVLSKDEKVTQKIDPAFTGYVTGFTSGVISKESEITVRLREEVALDKQTEEVASSLFDFDPNIEGEAYWKDKQTIVFKPTEYLPSGKLYDAEFDLSELMEVPKDLRVLEFQFQTIKQAVDVYFDGIFGSPTQKIEIIRHILDKEKSSNAVVFGDAAADLEAAINNGCFFVAYLPFSYIRQYLKMKAIELDFYCVDQWSDFGC